MNKKKKKKTVVKCRIRIFLALIVFGTVTVCLGYNLVMNIVNIGKMQNEKTGLKNQIVSLEEEKKILETDILKLKDPEYIAKYVREKYFYSKEGELILRIDD